MVFAHHHLSYTQERTTTLQENNLRGKVKSIVEYEYAMIDAEGNIDKEMGASGKIILPTIKQETLLSIKLLILKEL